MKNIKTIFFDLDNTLVYGEDASRYYEQYPLLLEKTLGLCLEIPLEKSKQIADDHRARFSGQGERAFETYGIGLSEWYEAMCTLDPSTNIRPLPQIQDFLRRLKANGYKLGVITDGPAVQADKILMAAGIDKDLFSTFIAWEKDSAFPKGGKNDIYQKIISDEKLDPSEILMVGDSIETDITPAAACGIRVFQVSKEMSVETVENYLNMPVIIDTDPGHDDALAIMLLEKSKMVDIKAVTTVAGNSTIENVTNNARYILNLLNSATPLYSGSAAPLKRPLVQAVVHGKSGLAGADVSVREPLTDNAVDKIISIVRACPGEISILAIGPQTNLAHAFIQDPELPSLIKQVVIMGGAIAVPGNKSRVAEFNVFVDPEAADIVFSANVRKVLIPLDVCNDIKLQMSDFEKLKGSPLYEPLLKMMKEYISGIGKSEKVNGALMYDPLAAYYLINPDAHTLEPMDIKIETKSELTRGMTIADRRIWGEKNYNVEVVTKIDGETFVEDLLEILKKKT